MQGMRYDERWKAMGIAIGIMGAIAFSVPVTYRLLNWQKR